MLSLKSVFFLYWFHIWQNQFYYSLQMYSLLKSSVSPPVACWASSLNNLFCCCCFLFNRRTWGPLKSSRIMALISSWFEASLLDKVQQQNSVQNVLNLESCDFPNSNRNNSFRYFSLVVNLSIIIGKRTDFALYFCWQNNQWLRCISQTYSILLQLLFFVTPRLD